jgi:hypothetical protein
MKLAIATRLLQLVRSQDASTLEVAAEASEGPLTREEYGLDEWWPYQALRSLEEEPRSADCPWRSLSGLIGS